MQVKEYYRSIEEWKIKVGYKEPETKVVRLEKMEDKICDLIAESEGLWSEVEDLIRKAERIQEYIENELEKAKKEEKRNNYLYELS